MLRIVIPSDKSTRSYEFKGQRYNEQEAAIYAGGHFPKPFHVTTKDGNLYPAGEYTLDPSSFGVSDRGKLILQSVRLLPTKGAGASK